MNLPGLTAEASLYRTNKQYSVLSLDFAGAASNAPVVPAYLPGPGQTAFSDCPDGVTEAYVGAVGLPSMLYSSGGSYGPVLPWGPNSSPGVDTGSITAASVPAHNPTINTAACAFCTIGSGLVYEVCLAQAITTAALCGPLYPLCLAAEWGICTISYLTYLGSTCHLNGTPGFTPGPPCCPVKCSGSCCGTGETCAAGDLAGNNLCCSPGLTACGTQNCCDPSETCLADGSCCPTARACGGVNCCSPGDTCLATGSCCPTARACGSQNCCNPGDTCLPNGSCCPPGHAVCGGICCPDPFDVCDPTTNACTLACPSGTQSCGGTCCAVGQKCCLVGTNGGLQQQCVTPQPPRNGYAWCGNKEIDCDCAPGQRCIPICQGGLCTTDVYCQ